MDHFFEERKFLFLDNSGKGCAPPALSVSRSSSSAISTLPITATTPSAYAVSTTHYYELCMPIIHSTNTFCVFCCDSRSWYPISVNRLIDWYNAETWAAAAEPFQSSPQSLISYQFTRSGDDGQI